MRLGIIDLGTNSIRFDVFDFTVDKKIRRLHREKLMVRLGEGVFTSGKLNKTATERTLQALVNFRRVANELKADKIIAVGTSALREASDRNRLIEEAKRLTGIEIQVISGTEEARLIALGVLKNQSLKAGRCALIDVGGGSTEISICEGKKIISLTSLPLGVARLQQLFLKTNPPPKVVPDPITALRKYIREVLEASFREGSKKKITRGIGSSGTIRALVRLKPGIQRKENILTLKSIRRLSKLFAPLSTQELLQMPGMDPKRVDLILAGSIVLEEILAFLGLGKIAISNASLKEGICREEFQRFRKTRGASSSFRYDLVFHNLRRLGIAQARLDQVVSDTKVLYERLARVHQLKTSWKHYLVMANLFLHAGKVISVANHGEHSYYLVKNTDLPFLAPWAKEFIGNLCLYHSEKNINQRTATASLDQEKSAAFLKLLALLRVASALHHDIPTRSLLKQVQTSTNRVKLSIAGSKTKPSIQVLWLEQRKDLFEKIFRRALFVESVG